MSLSEKVSPLLMARAATDPAAAKLLEMFTKAEQMLNESSPAGVGDVEVSKLLTSSNGRRRAGHNGYWTLPEVQASSSRSPVRLRPSGRLCRDSYVGEDAESSAKEFKGE